MAQCKKLLLINLMLFAVTQGFAQWSSDSLQNTAVIQYSNDQVVPKIAATSDGGCYVAWYDTRDGNYDVYLQRLNSMGEKLWASDGLQVSGHPQESWVTDYDLVVDQSDNAIVVFNDIRNGSGNGWDVFAYKIAPDGSFLWGADGVQLSAAINTDSEMSPKAAVTTAGNVVFVWSKSRDEADVIGMQKLSADGEKQWGADGITIQGSQGEAVTHPDIVPAADDSVIVVWKSEIGTYPATKIWLVTQKYDPNGQPAWDANGVVIYNDGNIPVYKDPSIIPDDASGAFYCWEDQPSSSESYVYVAHVGADGRLIFPLNGIKASTDATRLHHNPSISYIPTGEQLFLFWLEQNQSQSMFGIYGQKFNSAGDRLWTDEGKTFIPLGERSISFVSGAVTDTSIYVSYFQNSAPNAFDNGVKAFYINTDGQFYWQTKILSAASLGNKDDLLMVINTEDRAFCVWKDERDDNGDIYAQNINPDGTLGNTVSGVEPRDAGLVHRFQLEQNYPNPFGVSRSMGSNPVTVIRYQLSVVSNVELTVYNTLGQVVRRLVHEVQGAGKYAVTLDARGLPGGIYWYRLTADGETFTRKMVLIR